MTNSGGKPHAVGDRGQRYEVSVSDRDVGGRRTVCWTNSREDALRIAKSIESRPGWACGGVLDRATNLRIENEQ